ncbi:MAG: hypothetical protein ABIR54_03565 [Burkholderiaceae bacterium]
MSTPLPPFLVALGLDDTHDIDERTLRRAYARLLKQIDVEAEPQRFQALRESLDQSLSWLAWRERAQAADGDPSSVPDRSTAPAIRGPDVLFELASPAPAAPPGEASGSAVYADFHQAVTRVFRDVAGARNALERAMADPRLINIDARTGFEGHVARLLAEGWRPGHDHLLDPAVDAFGWERDHRRLGHFGQVGALVDAAIRDRAVFRQFNAQQAAVLNRLILRIRDATPPDPRTLHEEVQQLQLLVQRVPNWLRIVAPVDPVNARFEMWRESPASMRPAPGGPQPKFVGQKPASATLPGILVMAALIALFVFARLGSRESGGHFQQTAAQRAQVADIDLAQRQRQVEALLSNIQTASPAPSPRLKQKATQLPAATPTIAPANSGAGKPWWAPDWAGSPGSQVPELSPPTGIAPAR